jgi:hypothetical protein
VTEREREGERERVCDREGGGERGKREKGKERLHHTPELVEETD